LSLRSELLESIAEKIVDYREGDVPRRTPKRIEQWVSQFPEVAQDGILAEMDHMLTETYISRDDMVSFLRGLATHNKFCNGDPKAFWKNANILDIQQKATSCSSAYFRPRFGHFVLLLQPLPEKNESPVRVTGDRNTLLIHPVHYTPEI
jgi:hypothetical protein